MERGRSERRPELGTMPIEIQSTIYRYAADPRTTSGLKTMANLSQTSTMTKAVVESPYLMGVERVPEKEEEEEESREMTTWDIAKEFHNKIRIHLFSGVSSEHNRFSFGTIVLKRIDTTATLKNTACAELGLQPHRNSMWLSIHSEQILRGIPPDESYKGLVEIPASRDKTIMDKMIYNGSYIIVAMSVEQAYNALRYWYRNRVSTTPEWIPTTEELVERRRVKDERRW